MYCFFVFFNVLHVCMLCGCEGDGNAGVGSGGGVFAVSACMSNTRGSGVLSSIGDVLEMSVVRSDGGVCDMCMCLARGFTNPVGTGECWACVCVFGCGDVGGVGEWVGGLDQGWERRGGVMSV